MDGRVDNQGEDSLMETFISKVGEVICAVASIAPTIIVKVGEGAVIIGEAIKKVVCPGA